MSELGNFVDDGTNHYKASYGHDDLVMAAMQTEFVRNTLQYKILRDEFTSGLQPTDENIYNPFDDILLSQIEIEADMYSRRFGINRII
jgi:hypothetical protein